MCCSNLNTPWVKLLTKAMRDRTFRERFFADPGGVAREFGLSQTEQDELTKVDARRLRVMVEGPPPRSTLRS